MKKRKGGNEEIHLKKLSIKKFNKFFKLNRIKATILLVLVLISIYFQLWEFKRECLEIICKPTVLGISYYVFWPFSLLNILVLEHLLPNKILLFIGKVMFFFLQMSYWYLASCLLAIPVNKLRGKTGRFLKRKKREIEYEIKAKIARDLRHAENLEKERHETKILNAARRI